MKLKVRIPIEEGKIWISDGEYMTVETFMNSLMDYGVSAEYDSEAVRVELEWSS